MKIIPIPVGAFEVNCWILSNPNKQAIVIDPGAEPDTIHAHIQKKHLSVIGYLITHGHMDHISALAPLCSRHPAPIRMHPADAAWAFSAANQMQPYYAPPAAPPTQHLQPDLTESKDNQIGDFVFDIIETPGHSPGSVCIHFPTIETLFTGDTIVAGSAGRTDFPGGSASALHASLQRLRTMPATTKICAGHGPASSLEQEIRTNPFLQSA
jgi:hydroxyacylglutathione hydrolase